MVFTSQCSPATTHFVSVAGANYTLVKVKVKNISKTPKKSQATIPK